MNQNILIRQLLLLKRTSSQNVEGLIRPQEEVRDELTSLRRDVEERSKAILHTHTEKTEGKLRD